jgi:hypothetical protein
VVGDSEGWIDGNNVGNEVGDEVGDGEVGEEVGEAVGKAVGSPNKRRILCRVSIPSKSSSIAVLPP